MDHTVVQLQRYVKLMTGALTPWKIYEYSRFGTIQSALSVDPNLLSLSS